MTVSGSFGRSIRVTYLLEQVGQNAASVETTAVGETDLLQQSAQAAVSHPATVLVTFPLVIVKVLFDETEDGEARGRCGGESNSGGGQLLWGRGVRWNGLVLGGLGSWKFTDCYRAR